MKENAAANYLDAKAYFRGSMLGLVCGVFVSIFPVVGIKRSWDPIVADQGQLAFFLAFIFTMSFSGAILFQRWCAQMRQFPSSRRQVTIDFGTICGALLFFLLYFAANALSQRLSIGLIDGSAAKLATLRFVGLYGAFAGMILQITALLRLPATESVIPVRHPCFFATLIFLSGVPLAFGSWFALCALPGIFVTMKWVITFPLAKPQPERQEAQEVSTSLEPQEPPVPLESKVSLEPNAPQAPDPCPEIDWQLIPYVY